MRRVRHAALLGATLFVAACTAAPAASRVEVSVDDAGVDALSADAGARDASEPIDVASCTDCHETVTREWRTSAHHAAFTNDVFQNEWALHADPWCVRCHAPLADARAPSGAAAAAGITCAVCHVRGGELVSSHAAPGAPHAVRVDPTFGTEAQCAPCHNVKFPPTPMLHGARVASDEVLQRTITEWHGSGASAPCQSCHMAEVATPRRHASHLFPGGRDPALLARALDVEADAHCEAGRTVVHLRLEGADVGHAVPTGDVFRRLEVGAVLDGRPSTRATADLYRHFALGPDRLLHESLDDRVPASGVRDVEVVLRGCGRRVDWTVDWLAVDAEVAEARALDAHDARARVTGGQVAVRR